MVERATRAFLVLCVVAALIYLIGTGVHSLVTRGDLTEFMDHRLTVDHFFKELRSR